MDSILSYLNGKQPEMTDLIARLVKCESPSDDASAVNRCVDLVVSEVSDFAKVKTWPGGKFGRHLRVEFNLPGRKKTGQILALGHLDTVWPVGTLKTMPFREEQGMLWGPGVFDMKAGVAFCIFAARALRDLDLPVARKLVMQLNSDEEVGSDSSRAITETEARKSAAVLVLEPANGPDGKLKTGRKGVGDFVLKVHGKPSHAGLDFEAGASAILELARQIDKIAGFTDLKRGITVSPGLISGGTRTNVVAAEATCEFDFRVLRAKDGPQVEKKFHALRPFDKRCTLEISGGLNRPPLERTAGVIALFRKAQAISKAMGIPLDESTVGGGSDGNFTAGLGIPTLDGLGPVGDGAHAAHESIVVDRMADRTALITELVRTL
jgi:glutamate carboxypeptidase